jgi:hypothetical protein
MFKRREESPEPLPPFHERSPQSDDTPFRVKGVPFAWIPWPLLPGTPTLRRIRNPDDETLSIA